MGRVRKFQTDNERVASFRRKHNYSERRHARWTLAEIELARRSDIPASEIAKQLGRSINAVYLMRKKLKEEGE